MWTPDYMWLHNFKMQFCSHFKPTLIELWSSTPHPPTPPPIFYTDTTVHRSAQSQMKCCVVYDKILKGESLRDGVDHMLIIDFPNTTSNLTSEEKSQRTLRAAILRSTCTARCTMHCVQLGAQCTVLGSDWLVKYIRLPSWKNKQQTTKHLDI